MDTVSVAAQPNSTPNLNPNLNLNPNPTPNPLPIQSTPGFTVKEVKPVTMKTALKIGYMLALICLLVAGTAYFARRFVSKSKNTGEVLAEYPYQPVLWQDFGEVFEPMVKVPIFYPEQGYKNEEFLLDSGAVVSSLSREKAQEMNMSLAKLPRSTFAGFGNTTSFAYKANIKVKVGSQEMNIPAVFTEAASTKSILGRSGFFETYSIYFNAKTERIEIRK